MRFEALSSLPVSAPKSLTAEPQGSMEWVCNPIFPGVISKLGVCILYKNGFS